MPTFDVSLLLVVFVSEGGGPNIAGYLVFASHAMQLLLSADFMYHYLRSIWRKASQSGSGSGRVRRAGEGAWRAHRSARVGVHPGALVEASLLNGVEPVLACCCR